MITQHTIPITQITQAISADADFLVSRLTGQAFTAKLEDELRTIPAGTVVLIDFSDVELMDGSFADEVFGTIASARGRRQSSVAPFILCSLNSTSLDNLTQALLSRPAREDGLRNCVVPVRGKNSDTVLIGKFEDHVQQTFGLLNTSGELTTRDVADKLDLGTTAASTRLKVLYDLGLAVRLEIRDDQGKQFVYHGLG